VIDFMSGALTVTYFLAAVFFLRFWRRIRDRLFLAFAIAFALFGLNQALVFLLEVYSETYSILYALRVLGFLAILAAIVDKNLFAAASGKPSAPPDSPA
jgi:hypothetical protein